MLTVGMVAKSVTVIDKTLQPMFQNIIFEIATAVTNKEFRIQIQQLGASKSFKCNP
jgi:hypothetical protein